MKGKEKTVITAWEVRRWVEEKKIPFDDVCRIEVQCGNCGHRDILGKCLVRKKLTALLNDLVVTITVNLPSGNVNLAFSVFLECPKCRSSIIYVTNEELLSTLL